MTIEATESRLLKNLLITLIVIFMVTFKMDKKNLFFKNERKYFVKMAKMVQ